jgi:hypothetical protein
MGINLDITAVTPVLKQRYTDKKIETIAFVTETLGMLPKDPNYGGSLYVGAIRNATASSRSALDTIAFTTGSPSVYQQWQVSWKQDFASANITGQAIDQAKGDANALVDAMTGEFDGAFISLGISLGGKLWGNGGGAMGSINAASYAVTALTLVDISRIVNFYVGQIIQISTDDGTGGAGVLTGTGTVAGVDVVNGIVTLSANWSTAFTGMSGSTTYYIFQQGDYNAAVQGLPAWAPTSAARTGTFWTGAFNNVTRTSDPTRLAGSAYVGNGAPKAESLIYELVLVNRIGGRPTKALMNPIDYADVCKDLGTRVQYVTEEAFENAQISFDGVKVATPYGAVSLFSDPFVPLGSGWVVNMTEWLLPSMGKVPKVLGGGIDGMEWLRVAGADAYQSRMAYRACTYTSAPGHQGVVTF